MVFKWGELEGVFEREAVQLLPKSILGYYQSGADDEYTLARNKQAFSKYVLRPRALCDVSHLDASIRISFKTPKSSDENQKLSFDKTLAYPLAIAPTAFHCMAHPDGEIATVQAAGETGTLMICSTLATTSLENVAKSAPEGTVLWYQLYVYKNRQLTESLVKRAVASGYSALVLTVDAPSMGRRRADERNGFELPHHLRMANFDSNLFAKTREGSVGSSGFNKYALSLLDASLDWSDLQWLVNLSPIPVIVKGIMRADDAEKALEVGVAGIVVSNHGGRQVDHCAATIEALSEVVKAVKGRCSVFMDGGIRCGTDIFKAIALGANLVFIGRPVIYGLAVGGKDGVKHVINLLRTEFDYAMRLSGCATIQHIKSNPNLVVHESYFHPNLSKLFKKKLADSSSQKLHQQKQSVIFATKHLDAKPRASKFEGTSYNTSGLSEEVQQHEESRENRRGSDEARNYEGDFSGLEIACTNQPFTIFEFESFKALLSSSDRANLKGYHHYSNCHAKSLRRCQKEVTNCLNECSDLSFTSDICLTAQGIDCHGSGSSSSYAFYDYRRSNLSPEKADQL
uniref:(S)-2-hydroxy-acid oxidase n=1 Tax=Ditylenchus dipsaci TaxID=166011 RepID=A0A915EG70_9BILA